MSLPSEVAVGETITAKLGGVQPEPDGTRCTWSVGGAKREGLGACSYTVVEQDTGKPIEVQVTATRAGYEDHVVVGGPTSLVQGVLPTPVCSVKLVKITAEERWDAYCEVVQDPEATYQWCWYDHTLDAVIGRSECAVREDGHVYIVKARKGHLIQARVVVTRDGYRSREYVATAKAPDWN